jgi:RNA polymerase sigma factor (sigma-70 family)
MVQDSTLPSPADVGIECPLVVSPSCGPDLADVLFRLDPVLKFRSFRLAGFDRWLREDLYQEGISAIARATVRYNPAIGSLDGYAASCAINRMRHVCRAHRYRRIHLIPLDLGPEADADDKPELAYAGAEMFVANKMDGASIRDLLPFVLSSRERRVIESLFFEELPATLIGRKLRISAPRVTQIKYAALAKLRTALRIPKIPLN